MKCHKTNVCTPMHWELSKNTKCIIRNLVVLRYLNVTNFDFIFIFFIFLNFCSILLTKITQIQYLLDHMLSWVWTCYKIKWTQHMTIVLQGVCMNLNIFVIMELLKIIIDIVKKDKIWKYCCKKNTINWWNQMVCMSFKFDNFHPSCKYGLSTTTIVKTIDLLSSIIYCAWMSFLYLFYLNQCHIFESLTFLIYKLIWYSIIITYLN